MDYTHGVVGSNPTPGIIHMITRIKQHRLGFGIPTVIWKGKRYFYIIYEYSETEQSCGWDKAQIDMPKFTVDEYGVVARFPIFPALVYTVPPKLFL